MAIWRFESLTDGLTSETTVPESVIGIFSVDDPIALWIARRLDTGAHIDAAIPRIGAQECRLGSCNPFPLPRRMWQRAKSWLSGTV